MANVEVSAKFDNYKWSKKSVALLDYSKAVEYQQDADTCSNLMDHSAFGHKFADELSSITELEEILLEADYYINALYTYRSYSKPLPMIPADLDEQTKRPLYKQVFDILTPHVNKVKGLMEFHDRMMKCFTKNLRLLVYPHQKKEPLWKDQMRALNKVVDKFFVLDALKDMKGQMRNDFSRYKRAFSYTRQMLPNAGELMAEITAIHNFLNDPQHPYHIILYQLREDVRAVPQREELFSQMIQLALADISNHSYCTPQEKHGLYRTILASLYLCDDEQSNINVFKSKLIPIKEIKNRVKKLPLLPLFMDTKITAPLALSLCEHWSSNMESDWVSRRHADMYNLVKWRTRYQEQYIQYTADLVTLLHQLRSFNKEEVIPLDVQQRTWDLVITGFKLMGDWTAKVKEQIVYKATNPIDEAKYKILGGLGGKSQVYEQITRFNYDNDLKYAMVETIGLIKGLANLMLSNETKLRPILFNFVHERMQSFAHNSLLWPLFRSHKNKKGDLTDTLLTMRIVSADSFDINLLRQDYHKNKEKEIKKMAPHKWPQREVLPTRTQVLLMRRLTYHIFSEESAGMQGGLFSTKKKDLVKDEPKQFAALYHLLRYVEYVSQYSECVKKCSDLADLWYREFYLNLTDCIQFPIAMSLPWMLTDFAMNTPSLAPNVFFPLSIYNDCAEASITVFRQQHLFDEIEAEVNLVFDQLIFALYRKIFDYYKNKASKILMDKPFQRRMEAVRHKIGSQMLLNYARYGPIFQQKHINILGRTVDIHSLLTEQMNLFVRENVEAIISRYESSTITAVIEIEHLVRTLRLTVEMLREELPGIDPFDDVLTEVNEDTTLGSFRGRLFLRTYNELFQNLLRNYIFNQQTRRFVSLTKPKGSRRVDHIYLWGSRFTQVFQQRFKVTRGFFGVEHLKAIVELMGVDSMPLLVDETVKTVAHIIIREFSPYVDEILKALDPMKLQSAFYGVLGVYGYYDLVLKYIKSYPALREGVFTLLRESGNAICLVQMMDMVLSQESYYMHQIQAFYLGVEPARFPEEAKEEDVKYSSAAAVMNRPAQSPFVSILKMTLNAMQKDKNKHKKDLSREEGLIDSCIRNAMRRETFLTTNSGGWLFSAALEYLYKNLEETGLLKKWKGPTPSNGILEHENPKDFARFWSVATFIFLVPDFSPEEEEKKRAEGYVADRAYFGDGWLWAGTTILFLTGLQHRYRLLDPTIYIDKLQRLYPADLNKIEVKRGIFGRNKGADVNKKTEAYKPFVKGLLNGWHEMEKDVDLINAVLAAHFTPLKEPITRFTPRWEDGK